VEYSLKITGTRSWRALTPIRNVHTKMYVLNMNIMHLD
jgi:acyl dehydratase